MLHVELFIIQLSRGIVVVYVLSHFTCLELLTIRNSTSFFPIYPHVAQTKSYQLELLATELLAKSNLGCVDTSHSPISRVDGCARTSYIPETFRS